MNSKSKWLYFFIPIYMPNVVGAGRNIGTFSQTMPSSSLTTKRITFFQNQTHTLLINIRPFISNFWCIALYPKYLEENSNSFITNARTLLRFSTAVLINLHYDELRGLTIFHYRKDHF